MKEPAGPCGLQLYIETKAILFPIFAAKSKLFSLAFLVVPNDWFKNDELKDVSLHVPFQFGLIGRKQQLGVNVRKNPLGQGSFSLCERVLALGIFPVLPVPLLTLKSSTVQPKQSNCCCELVVRCDKWTHLPFICRLRPDSGCRLLRRPMWEEHPSIKIAPCDCILRSKDQP